MALTQPVAGPVVDDQVLDIVAGLVNELSGGAAPPLTLDDSLDRDGSLRDAAHDDITRGCGESAFASQTTGQRG